MEINTKNLKTIVIDGNKYSVDLNDFKTMQSIMDFSEKLLNKELTNPTDLLKESRKLIDATFGKGSSKTIFPKDTLTVYYVALQIKKIYQEEFIAMQEKLQPDIFDKEKADLIEYTGVLQKFNEQMDYARGRYDVDAEA